MMSHEEPHAPHGPEDPEDTTGDEEGDMEARTAVEALLALTSPTDYTHHAGYDDDYMMEEVPEEYDADKAAVVKEVFEAEGDTREGEVIESDTPIDVPTDTLTETGNGPFIPGATESNDINQSDEGLKQLQAFVQATEGREEVSPKAPETSNHGILNPDDSLLINSKSKAYRERSAADSMNKVVESSLQPVKTECDSSTSECGEGPLLSSVMAKASAKYDVTNRTENKSSVVIVKVHSTEKCDYREVERLSLATVHTRGDFNSSSGNILVSDTIDKELCRPEMFSPSSDLTDSLQDRREDEKSIVMFSSDDSDSDDSDNNSDTDNSDSNSSSSSSDSDTSSDGSDSDGSDSDSDSEDDSKCINKAGNDAEPAECVKEPVEKEADAQVVKVEKEEKKEMHNFQSAAKGPKATSQSLERRKSEGIESLKNEEKDVKAFETKGSVDVCLKESKSLLDLKRQLDKVDLGGSVSISVVKTKSDSSKESSSNARRIVERKSAAEIMSLTEKCSISGNSVKSLDGKTSMAKETVTKKDDYQETKESHSRESKSPVAKRSEKSNGNSCSPSPTACDGDKSQVDLVREVAVAFARQLSSIQLKNATGKEREQKESVTNGRSGLAVHVNRKSSTEERMEVRVEKEGEEKENDRGEVMEAYDGVKLVMAEEKRVIQENKRQTEDEEEEEDDDRGEWEDIYPMPIQAEVVMSEGSESGLEYDGYEGEPGQREEEQGDEEELSWCKKGSEMLDMSEKENQDLLAYLRSFILGGGSGELVEYPPANNEVPTGGQDLTQWQLEGVRLPPFTPTVAPPPWLRLTIPPEGYRCLSCGDTFFIEGSLVQHRERRSVWISLECGPCDAKLTFYNRCALKDHLREHMVKDEEVDEETVEVRSLPLQLTRLLQPILVPVPQALTIPNKKLQRRLKGHSTLARPPVLKPIGRQRGSLGTGMMGEDGKDDGRLLLNSDKQLPDMKRKRVRCYLCERTYHSVRELMAHMRTDQSFSDQRVECRKCQLVLPSVCAAKAHILTHPPANTSNISVCPECGSRCEGPREFVHHLNTCGHQYRRSGVLCGQCSVCFFRSQEDFLAHWISEHCGKSYECVVCHCTFESLVFHKCMSPGQQVLATFRCLLTCPLCSATIQLHAQQEEQDTSAKVRAHLVEHHPTVVSRVHYVYKSKFCTNAFRSKDELRAHHDREHRRDNHYRTKTCTLHHEVLGYQHQYFGGQEPRNAFVTLPVALSPEELQEANTRDVPTVSSVVDKTLFPDVTPQELTQASKLDKPGKNKGGSGKSLPKEGEGREGNKDPPIKKDMDQLDRLRPRVCYRCGRMYSDNKDFRKHKKQCEGEAAERTCLVCGLIAVGEDFARHCLSHIQDGVILCIYCNGTQFSSHSDLVQHFELHVHEQFSYPAACAFCGSSLPDVPTALAHLNQEHDPLHVPFDTSEFECDRCGRRFHGERGLSVHLGRCSLGAAPPAPTQAGCRQCQVCHKALTSEMFGRHMVCHLEEGLLVCSLCDGRALPSSMALLHHLEEHAASPSCPATCPMCNLAIPDPEDALTHLKEEHGFGNLRCSECDMHFNFTYQLQRHIDIVHKICRYAKRRYICWICRAYDHVKKETLMNHFRTVHGLDRAQVDEKVMIRTRGQGTMPTSQFIPTKPLGSKEHAALVAARPDIDKGKTSPAKSSTGESPGKQGGGRSFQSKDVVQRHLTPHTSPVKDSSQKLLDPQVTPVKNSPVKLLSPQDSPAKQPGHSVPPVMSPRSNDSKLKEKTKVLIKRLPDSILDEQSRSKKRRKSAEGGELGGSELEKKQEKRHRERKKKKKSFRCSMCSFGTNFREKLETHLKRHEEDGEGSGGLRDGFVCGECGASFVVEPSLARHMFFAHKVKLQVSSADENDDVEKGKVTKKRGATDMECQAENEKLKEEKVTEIKVEEEALAKRKTARLTVKKKMEDEKAKKNEVKNLKKEDNAIKTRGSVTITRRVTERKRTVPTRNIVKRETRRRSSGERNGVGKKGIENEELNGLGRRRGGGHKEEDSQKLDNQCVVCKEEFTNPVELYSHLRTHGMAFLKLGRKARPLGLNTLTSVRSANE